MTLSAREISFRYRKGPIVLDRVSCAIRAGTICAIVGPNGAGKSTLVRLLAGLRTPESGVVRLGDAPIRSLSPRRRARRIAFLEQRPSLAFDFSVRRVVSFGAYAGQRRSHLVDDALRRFELGDIADNAFNALSVGQQQRSAFARAWVQIAGREDACLLADEPCSAMDPRHTLQTMHAMRGLAQSGAAVCVVLHDLNTAIRFADDAIVLNAAGSIVAQGPAPEAMTPQTLGSVFEVPIARREIEGGAPLLIVGDASE